MSDGTHPPQAIELRQVATASAVALGMAAALTLGYLLLDILLLLFLGIVLAAALQPSHRLLCRWGVPKAPAVLLIYLLLLVCLALLALVVGPVLVEQLGTFGAEAPETYARTRSHLQANPSAALRLIGKRLPPFDRLVQMVTEVAPQWYQAAAGLTAAIVKLPIYFVTVLAIGFYWTMEVPHFERLLLSLLAVEQRPRALNVWHEIESKLGGFIRGQGLAMLTIGAASAVGYALVGLPNVMALAVLAGLLEAVPLIGPTLAVAPAVILALPMGGQTVLLVIGLAVLLQFIENNVLVPRIMHHAVGVSALVNLLAVLSFGTLYGIAGILVAIPMTAVLKVLLDTLVLNAEPVAEPESHLGSPWLDLRARLQAVRQQARLRLRARGSRMGIDPGSADHVVDAVDQRIEAAVARIEKVILLAENPTEPWPPAAQAAILERLQDATEEIAQAAERADIGDSTVEFSSGEPSPATTEVAAEDVVEQLDRATERLTEAVQDAEDRVAAAQAGRDS